MLYELIGMATDADPEAVGLATACILQVGESCSEDLVKLAVVVELTLLCCCFDNVCCGV